MKHVRKLLCTGYGLLLLSRYLKVFDAKHFKGKRIAIVGPANSAYNTGKGGYIDNFDIVVRVNKAPILVKSGKFKLDIGSKTDILFHSFLENERTGGGTLNLNLYEELGIKYIINPIPGYFGIRNILNFYKKYFLRHKMYILPKRYYDDIKARFGSYRPTTGFAAMQFLLNTDFSELYITGFTFFKTAYGDGYRDELKDIKINQKHIASENQHSPEIEFQEFKRILVKNCHKTVIMDSVLTTILKQN